MNDDDLRRLHGHLAATAERPLDREANRWLGEAEAVAGQLVDAELDDDVLEERLDTVERLLSKVDETGDPEADDRVASAKAILDSR